MPLRSTLQVALAICAFGVAGGIATLPFVLASDSPRDSAIVLAPAAVAAAGVVGGLSWWLFVVGGGPRWRAPLAGAVAGLGAHPLMWGIVSVTVGTETGLSASDVATGALASSFFFSLFSMLIYGPLTVPLGVFVGWALGRALDRRRR